MSGALPTLEVWLAAGPSAQRAHLARIAQVSSRELLDVMSEAEPRRYRTHGPRLVHRRSGLRFCLVPAHAGRRAFLIAEAPLGTSEAAYFGLDRWSVGRRVFGDQAAPLYLGADEIGALGVAPFRLPRDDEWEAAYRAGTTTSFFWGERPPSAPPSVEHPLGLAMPGWWDELTADGTVRGGGATLWPWTNGDGVRRLRADARRAWDDEPTPRAAAVRLVCALPEEVARVA